MKERKGENLRSGLFTVHLFAPYFIMVTTTDAFNMVVLLCSNTTSLHHHHGFTVHVKSLYNIMTPQHQ